MILGPQISGHQIQRASRGLRWQSALFSAVVRRLLGRQESKVYLARTSVTNTTGGSKTFEPLFLHYCIEPLKLGHNKTIHCRNTIDDKQVCKTIIALHKNGPRLFTSIQLLTITKN